VGKGEVSLGWHCTRGECGFRPPKEYHGKENFNGTANKEQANIKRSWTRSKRGLVNKTGDTEKHESKRNERKRGKRVLGPTSDILGGLPDV